MLNLLGFGVQHSSSGLPRHSQKLRDQELRALQAENSCNRRILCVVFCELSAAQKRGWAHREDGLQRWGRRWGRCTSTGEAPAAPAWAWRWGRGSGGLPPASGGPSPGLRAFPRTALLRPPPAASGSAAQLGTTLLKTPARESVKLLTLFRLRS